MFLVGCKLREEDERQRWDMLFLKPSQSHISSEERVRGGGGGIGGGGWQEPSISRFERGRGGNFQEHALLLRQQQCGDDIPVVGPCVRTQESPQSQRLGT
jgi:hypothetical protein